MSTTYFATAAGTSFHQDMTCRSLRAGQDIWDYDCDEQCRHYHPHQHAIRPTTIQAAMGDGKLPCRTCMPELLGNWFRTPCENDFGHEPIDEYAGTPEGERGVSNSVCARCMRWAHAVDGIQIGGRVPWPCTSAIVLGLVEREPAGTDG